jgi:hypothetical protein
MKGLVVLAQFAECKEVYVVIGWHLGQYKIIFDTSQRGLSCSGESAVRSKDWTIQECLLFVEKQTLSSRKTFNKPRVILQSDSFP